MKTRNFKTWALIALLLTGVIGIPMVFAVYNSPWVRTQALYLNDVLVTSTAAELNAVDGLTGDVITTTSTSTLTNKTLTSPVLNTGVSGTAILDEDNMASDSATQLATQQSIKAYVDSGRHVLVQGEIVDVSSAASSWTVSPVAGDIIGAYIVIDGAVSGSDASITFEIAAAATTGGVITIAASAAGSTYTATAFTGNNTVTAGQSIEILTDGGSTDAAKGTVVLVIEGVPSTPLRYIQGEIANISAGVVSTWTVSPIAGTITNIWTVIDGAIADVDAIITLEIAATPITGGAITVAFSGSAPGDVDTTTPSAANTVTAGQAIEIITNGASTNAVKAEILIEITP